MAQHYGVPIAQRAYVNARDSTACCALTSKSQQGSSITTISHMPPTTRRLFLHASALSGAEYATYTAAMRDILDDKHVPGASVTNSDDDEIERTKVSVREVRAWVRGRYPNVTNADQVRTFRHR